MMRPLAEEIPKFVVGSHYFSNHTVHSQRAGARLMKLCHCIRAYIKAVPIHNQTIGGLIDVQRICRCCDQSCASTDNGFAQRQCTIIQSIGRMRNKNRTPAANTDNKAGRVRDVEEVKCVTVEIKLERIIQWPPAGTKRKREIFFSHITPLEISVCTEI